MYCQKNSVTLCLATRPISPTHKKAILLGETNTEQWSLFQTPFTREAIEAIVKQLRSLFAEAQGIKSVALSIGAHALKVDLGNFYPM